MSINRAILAGIVVAFLSAGAAQAQTPAPENRTVTEETTPRVDRVDDDEFNLGWLGLIGLLGLAGLAGGRRGDHTTRSTNVRTDRV